MRLTFEQIKEITTGAVTIVKRENGIHFYKCTAKQIAAWYAFSDVLGNRASTTTGVRLDFYTDSPFFEFCATRGAKFEILINGILRKRIDNPESKEFVERFEIVDSVGKRSEKMRVTIVFPSHAIGVLNYLEVADGSFIEHCKYDRKILFIGDSITQGHNSYFDTLSYAWRVTEYFNADSVINGIGGAFFAESTFDVPEFDPDMIIIAYGTNDFGKYGGYEGMKPEVCKYLDLVKEHYSDKKVFVLSPIWRAKNDGSLMGEEFDKARKMIEEEARLRGFTAIDGLKLVAPDPMFYSDKYLHPNDLGFSLYSENLIKAIEKG